MWVHSNPRIDSAAWALSDAARCHGFGVGPGNSEPHADTHDPAPPREIAQAAANHELLSGLLVRGSRAVAVLHREAIDLWMSLDVPAERIARDTHIAIIFSLLASHIITLFWR